MFFFAIYGYEKNVNGNYPHWNTKRKIIGAKFKKIYVTLIKQSTIMKVESKKEKKFIDRNIGQKMYKDI